MQPATTTDPKRPPVHPSLVHSVGDLAEMFLLASAFAAIWISVIRVLIAAIVGLG
jgi:hypothetical protein